MLDDDSTDPNITTDDSGMSVVTVTAGPDRDSALLSLVLFGVLMWMAYGDRLMRHRHWPQALRVSQKLCRVAPDCCTGFLHASFCLHELGQTAQAKKVLLKGPPMLLKEPIYYYNMGCYEALLGNVGDAQLHLQTSFEMDSSFRELAKKDPDLKALQEFI